ncbi:acetyl-CoA carboxylase, biotin carboxyl carrier protein [bacterium]|nr:acetyl-CoA carboxylase, biotin carboxyl carrier protein [bacterium]
MEKLDIDISQVKKLLELVESHNLEELTVESDDLSITVKGTSSKQATQVMVQAAGQIEASEQIVEEYVEEEHEHPQAELEGNIVDITAPLVGVFYRAPSPDAPVFVEVGDSIEVGTEVGLIEAMKVFSPIPSEIAGVVVDIPTTNGALVHEGDVLFRVRVGEE